MKRHNNLFDKIVDKDNLLLAYKKAKKHKNWQQKVIRVEKDLDNLIEGLRLSLINGTYKTAEYRTKKIYEPKERTIYVLPFYPDRIVHHAIMNILEPNCDDFLLFSNDKALLKEMAIKIKDYVENILKLRLSKCNLFPTSQGIDFLGYRHFSSGYILVRKTTAKRMKKRIRRLKWELAKKKITNDRALSVIGSISGWLKWANTYNLQIFLQLNELKESIGGSVNEQI